MKNNFFCPHGDLQSPGLDTVTVPQSRQAPDSLSLPKASEVLGEIGLLLALHLAMAFAIVATVQGLGLA